MKKNKIKIYQADFVFMIESQAYDFDNCIIWKWGKVIKRKYDRKLGYVYRCQFKTIDEGTNCLIECCMKNKYYAIAINQKVKSVRV